MITICPNCGSKIEKGIVKCPKCAELLFENTYVEGPGAVVKDASFHSSASLSVAPPPKIESRSGSEKIEAPKENSLSTTEAARMIYSTFKTRIIFWNILMVWSVILSLVAVFLVTRTTMMLSEMVDKNIAERFLNKNVGETILEVAQKEAVKIIEKQLNPALIEANKKIQETSSSIESSKNSFDEKYADLAKQSMLLEGKKLILKLSEQSLRGYRKAYEELVARAERKEPEELAQMVQEEINRIKNNFRLSNRIEGVTISYTNPSGTGLINESIPTEILIKTMQESPSWKLRARAAQILGNRFETEVPDLLLETAEIDSFLDVVKYALQSFSKITGYEENEVFEVRKARAWWQENKPGIRMPQTPLQEKEKVNE